MAISGKPAIVIAQGSWHVPQHGVFLRAELERHGYEVTQPAYPSTGGRLPAKDALGDIEAVRAAAKKYIDQGKNVCITMFSYGGFVGTAAADGLLPHESPNGKGVVSLVYIAAFVPAENDSVYTMIGGAYGPWIRTYRDIGAGGWVAPDNAPFEPGQIFYNDCPPEVQDENVGLLRLFSEAAFHTKSPVATWRKIESNYLMCELDQAIPLAVQEALVAAKADGKWKRIERMSSGHSPFLSRPRETAEFIRKCVGEDL